MSIATTVFQGIVHGKTMELDHEPDLPDGEQVTVIVQSCAEGRKLPPGEGLRLSCGGWADDAQELDEFLAWNRDAKSKE